jgi:hypothetical protein
LEGASVVTFEKALVPVKEMPLCLRLLPPTTACGRCTNKPALIERHGVAVLEQGKAQLDEVLKANEDRSALEFGAALADIEKQTDVDAIIAAARATAEVRPHANRERLGREQGSWWVWTSILQRETPRPAAVLMRKQRCGLSRDRGTTVAANSQKAVVSEHETVVKRTRLTSGLLPACCSRREPCYRCRSLYLYL